MSIASSKFITLTALAALSFALTTAGLRFVFADADKHSTAGTGTKTLQLGGVTGVLGHLDGQPDVSQGEYGHVISGDACQGDDNKTEENNLEVHFSWMDQTSTDMTITATSTIENKNYVEIKTTHNCPQGPPSFPGTSTITLNDPAMGTGGGTTPAGASTVSLGSTSTGSTGTEQSGVLNPVAWDVMPNDPDTHVRIVSAKVTCEFNGDIVEYKQVASEHTANCILDADAN